MANPMMGAMGMGAYPTFGGYGGYYKYPGMETRNMTLAELSNYQSNLRSQQYDQQVNEQAKYKYTKFRYNSPDSVIQDRIAALQEKIHSKDYDNVKSAYDSYVTAVRSVIAANPNNHGRLNDENIDAYAKQLYQETTGRSIIDDLNTNKDTAFTAGIKKGLLLNDSLGMHITSRKTADELISDIGKVKHDQREVSSVKMGKVVGGGITGLGTYFGIMGLTRLIKGSSGGPIAKTIAAVAATIIGGIGALAGSGSHS